MKSHNDEDREDILISDVILSDVERFTAGDPQSDDRALIVVVREAE